MVTMVPVVVALAFAVVIVLVGGTILSRPDVARKVGRRGLVGVEDARDQDVPGGHGSDDLAVEHGRLVDVTLNAPAIEVEGPIIAMDPADLERDLRPLAHRYLGAQMGDAYVEKARTDPEHAENVLVRMRPDRWLTADFAKAYGSS